MQQNILQFSAPTFQPQPPHNQTSCFSPAVPGLMVHRAAICTPSQLSTLAVSACQQSSLSLCAVSGQNSDGCIPPAHSSVCPPNMQLRLLPSNANDTIQPQDPSLQPQLQLLKPYIGHLLRCCIWSQFEHLTTLSRHSPLNVSSESITAQAVCSARSPTDAEQTEGRGKE